VVTGEPEYRTAVQPIPWKGDDMLIFTSNGTLATINPDGRNRRYLGATNNFEAAPAWSDDGRYIAFISDDKGNNDIFITSWVNLGDPEYLTNITKSPDVKEGSPCWSPDGRQIAFNSLRRGNWGIFTAELMVYDDYVDPVLLRQRRLTSNNRYEGHPDWSPDNEWIAYTSDRGFRWQIYLSHVSGARTLPMTGTTNLRSTAYPAWSPDGSRIAFASTFSGSWDIYVMDTDGSDLLQLTSHPGQDWHPSWSPNGEWLVFISDRSGNNDLFITEVDGMNLIQVTDTDVVEDAPAWNIPYNQNSMIPLNLLIR
jgi:Tol biopolymer transport system component